jgi:D-amino-acid dehydrogenase
MPSRQQLAAPRSHDGGPGGRAAIAGAGIAGLSVAWFLQEEGFQVTIYDPRGVAGGASAGNAGWICPAMIAPRPEPSVLRYGMASLLRPASPVRIPLTTVPATWRFLAAFAPTAPAAGSWVTQLRPAERPDPCRPTTR